MTHDALLKIIPEYIDQLLRLIAGPRQFFNGRDLNDKKILVQSLLFLFNSAILGFVLKTPFPEDSEGYWSTAMVTVILYTPTAVVLGCLVFCCFRLFGGKGTLPGHVVIFSYFAGVSALFFAMVSLVAKGIIKVKMPGEFALYQEYMNLLFSNSDMLEQERFKALAESQEMLFSMLVLGVGFILISGWLLVAWRAFGDWNNTTRMRTNAALILFLIIGYGVSTVLGLAQFAAGITLF